MAYRWGRTLVVAGVDVLHAFDSIDQDRLAQALWESGLHAAVVAAILYELHALEARMHLPTAPTGRRFQYGRGGK